MNTEFGSIHSRGLGVHLRQRPIFTYNGERIKDPGSSAWRRAKKRPESTYDSMILGILGLLDVLRVECQLLMFSTWVDGAHPK